MTSLLRDLFGARLKTRRPDFEAALERRDHQTVSERAERARWLRKHFPEGGLLLPLDTLFVFEEAKSTFIEGRYIATVVLSAAFAEQWMAARLAFEGYNKEVKSGFRACISLAREIEAWPAFILDQLDWLQDVRNPFIHLKPMGHVHSLTSRSLSLGREVEEVLKSDAQKALGAVFALVEKSK